jgi:hypothetical protein
MTGGDVGALLGGWRKVADEDQRIVVCMKPATMVSGSLSRAKLAISKPRRHGASPGSAGTPLLSPLPGLRGSRTSSTRSSAAACGKPVKEAARSSAGHRARAPLAPIAPSVVISQSCFVISWARRRWPHGSTRRTGDPLGSRRKGLPPLDPHLFCTNLKYIRRRTRVV